MTATIRLRIATNSKSVTVIAITSSVEEKPPTVFPGTGEILSHLSDFVNHEKCRLTNKRQMSIM